MTRVVGQHWSTKRTVCSQMVAKMFFKLCVMNCMPGSMFESSKCVYENVHMLPMPPADALFMYFLQK